VADKVEDILPMLKNAAAAVSADETEMPAVIADRL
jgi:hypothetical protein